MAKKTFEESMSQLEKIVEALEAGNLPLDKALKKFEEGIELSRFCFQKLEETEQKITRLMEASDGNAAETAFAAEAKGDHNVSEDE